MPKDWLFAIPWGETYKDCNNKEYEVSFAKHILIL